MCTGDGYSAGLDYLTLQLDELRRPELLWERRIRSPRIRTQAARTWLRPFAFAARRPASARVNSSCSSGSPPGWWWAIPTDMVMWTSIFRIWMV